MSACESCENTPLDLLWRVTFGDESFLVCRLCAGASDGWADSIAPFLVPDGSTVWSVPR